MIPATRLVASSSSRLRCLASSTRLAHRTAVFDDAKAMAALDEALSAVNHTPDAKDKRWTATVAKADRESARPTTSKLQQGSSTSDILDAEEGEQGGPPKRQGERPKPSGPSRFAGTKKPWTSALAKQSAIRPAVQSARVKDLGEKGRLDEAVDLVVNAPRFTVNTQTWNTLLSVLMGAGKRKEAYKMYIEMKRRTIDVDGLTFSTMLAGMASVPDWVVESNNLTRSEKLFEDFEEYKQKCATKGEVDPKLIRPINAYIQLLARAGKWDKAVDVYYSIADVKPLVADAFTYTALFEGLGQRKTADKKGELSIAEQNATDAKFFWRRMEKDMDAKKIKPDTLLVIKLLTLLTYGRPADHQFGLEVIRDYCGLAAPGETAPRPQVHMNQLLQQTILELCNRAKKYRLCLSFSKQVADWQRTSSPMVSGNPPNQGVLNAILTAQGQLAALEGPTDESSRAIELIRPWFDRILAYRKGGKSSVNPGSPILPLETTVLALRVCWRCADWPAALEMLSMASRVPVAELTADKPPERVPSHRLDFAAYSYLARTALESGEPDNMRQFLRLAAVTRLHSNTREGSHYPFYRAQYSSAVVKMISHIRSSASTADGEGKKEATEEFVELEKECKNWLAKYPLSNKVSPQSKLPELEESVFGSAKYVDKLTQAIDFEMATRSQ